ncbi:MAG: hypothetical protein QOG48_2168 [Verrucomicrobiota bacterium]
MIRLRKKDELLGAIASPARGDGDAILFVNGVTKFAGEESFGGWRFVVHMREV